MHLEPINHVDGFLQIDALTPWPLRDCEFGGGWSIKFKFEILIFHVLGQGTLILK